jgi:hypothetical protein
MLRVEVRSGIILVFHTAYFSYYRFILQYSRSDISSILTMSSRLIADNSSLLRSYPASLQEVGTELSASFRNPLSVSAEKSFNPFL